MCWEVQFSDSCRHWEKRQFDRNLSLYTRLQWSRMNGQNRLVRWPYIWEHLRSRHSRHLMRGHSWHIGQPVGRKWPIGCRPVAFPGNSSRHYPTDKINTCAWGWRIIEEGRRGRFLACDHRRKRGSLPGPCSRKAIHRLGHRMLLEIVSVLDPQLSSEVQQTEFALL